MSSVRKLVFKHATAPAIVLSYSFNDNDVAENRFEYISMKPNLFFELFDIIVVENTDVKYVQQKLLLAHDWAWKTLVYGLSGDIDVIMELKSRYSTLEKLIKSQTPAILKGQGVEYHDGELKDASHLLGLPLLDSDTAIDHFILFENHISPFAKTKIHRPREVDLFHAPYCLVLRGLDTTDYTMKAVCSEKDFIFTSAIYAMKGEKEQKNVLLNITGLLNSELYAYFNLMLGSSLGIEREQRHMNEVLDFPVVYSDDIACQVAQIQQQLHVSEDFALAQDATSEIENLNKTIFEAFGLADNHFIDYALNVQMPQLKSTKKSEAFRVANNQDLRRYTKPFFDTLSSAFAMSDKFVTANIYPTVSKYYSAVEFMLHSDKPLNEIEEIADETLLQAALTKFSVHKINSMFFELKDVIYFESDSFFIIKPNYYKNWHPAIAQLDLSKVIDQILSSNGGNN
jgi:hypothetical protein